jgi:uncharacterized membrane protein
VYFTILLVLHILGAVVGIGSTYAFSILGPNAGKASPEGAMTLLMSMMDIEKKIVTPVVLFTQPLTGVLLIFESGRNHNFFSHTWLWVALLLYAFIIYGSYLINTPATHRMVDAMKAGTAGTPEFLKDLKKTQTLGPIFGVLGVIIVVLMVWKPGDF